jgi:tRNA(adenine34) deaminase
MRRALAVAVDHQSSGGTPDAAASLNAGVGPDAGVGLGLDTGVGLGAGAGLGGIGGADVPIGAVVFGPEGEELAVGRNERELTGDPTAHAEILALRRAALRRGSWRLEGCTLVVTVEPCTMCAGALVLARVSSLVFGAWEPKTGAVGSLWDVVRDPRLNHRPEVYGGVLDEECAALLRDFFDQHRPGPT